MQYPKYQTLTVSPDAKNYTFISSGPKGDFEIEVQFTIIGGTDFYNLGFGVVNELGEVDNTIVLNNDERNKILATVAGFVNIFLDSYSITAVLFSGSTSARTRLYRRAKSINFDQLKKDFTIFRIISYDSGKYEIFDPSREYEAFLVTK